MTLGLVITDDRYMDEVVALIRTALERGWAARLFLTSFGVRVLEHQPFASLVNDVDVSVCEHSLEEYPSALAAAQDLRDYIVIGGQYQNAELTNTVDRMMVI